MKLRRNIGATGEEQTIRTRRIDRTKARIAQDDFPMRRQKLTKPRIIAFPNP